MTVDITALRELLAKATQDEWQPGTHGHANLVAFGGDDIVAVAEVYREDNHRLICAAVNALPALLDEVERLRAAQKQLFALEAQVHADERPMRVVNRAARAYIDRASFGNVGQPPELAALIDAVDAARKAQP